MTAHEEWLPVSQAAKHVSRSRQTIDALARSGKLESKTMGEKKILHVHIPSLMKYYSDKSLSFDNKQMDSKDYKHIDSQIEIATVKSECKRLSDLLTINERLLSEAKTDLRHYQNEVTKERNKNENLQQELLKISIEMHSFIKNESGVFNYSKIKDRIFSKKK